MRQQKKTDKVDAEFAARFPHCSPICLATSPEKREKGTIHDRVITRTLAEYGIEEREDGGYGIGGAVLNFRRLGACYGEHFCVCDCPLGRSARHCEHVKRMMDCNDAICEELGQFEIFRAKYINTFHRMMGYSPNAVGNIIYAEKMAALYDAHPDWAEAVESDPSL
jgi:hypothetical protein